MIGTANVQLHLAVSIRPQDIFNTFINDDQPPFFGPLLKLGFGGSANM